jgi:hypothetical protein
VAVGRSSEISLRYRATKTETAAPARRNRKKNTRKIDLRRDLLFGGFPFRRAGDDGSLSEDELDTRAMTFLLANRKHPLGDASESVHILFCLIIPSLRKNFFAEIEKGGLSNLFGRGIFFAVASRGDAGT